MKLAIRAAVAALSFGVSAPALAQDSDTGVYISANAGIASVSDLDVTYFGPTGTFGGSSGAEAAVGTFGVASGTDTAEFAFDLKSAAAFRGAIGYDFGMIRTDVEVSYHRNKASSVTLNRVNGAAVTITAEDRADICDYLDAGTCGGAGNTFTFDGSRARQLSALANLWLDLPINSTITPYVGGGVGATGYELDGEGKVRFAWQAGAGLAFNLSPSIALTGDYRYRQAGGVTIEDEEFPGEGLKLAKVKSSIFSAGVRFRF